MTDSQVIGKNLTPKCKRGGRKEEERRREEREEEEESNFNVIF
jgi:hypothetical protein